MKKVLVGGILLAVIMYVLPVPVTRTESISINAHYDRIMGKISHLESWRQWWPAAAGSIGVTGDTMLRTSRINYVLKERQPLSILLTEGSPHTYHVVSVVPSPGDTGTVVHWTTTSYLRTAVARLFSPLAGNHSYSTATLLQSLKLHMEDPVQYYGYVIRVEPVEDSIVLVMREACDRTSVPGCLRNMFRALNRQLRQEGYAGRAEQMFYIDSTAPGVVHIMAGLSINRVLPAMAPYEIMRMPKAHLVVGYFSGNYNNIRKPHQAISQFMKDHRIATAAVPYEKVLTNPQTAADSLKVKVKLYHPAMIP